MKVKINQNELYKAINIVQKAVSSRTTQPILTGILLEAIENQLILTATDLEIGIKTYINCEIIEKGQVVMQSRLLGDFIRKLPNNENVYIESFSNSNVEIKCLKSEINILGNSAEEYPQDIFNEGENDHTFNIKSEYLKNLIKYTHFSASQDPVKPIFTGCLIEIKNNICTFVALDGYRMAIRKENIDCEREISCIVPVKTMVEILRIIEENEDDIIVNISNNHISFKIENTIIVSNLLDGKFIDYSNLLKDTYNTIININSTNFKNSIERASLFAKDDKNNLIIFDILEDSLKINSSSEYGNLDEEILINKSGEDIKIGFNSKYILDVLKVVGSENINMNIVGKNNPCFIKEEENDNYIYMILPVRIS